MNGEDIMSKEGAAAIFKGANKCFEIRKYPVVSPSENQVLLSLKLSGICGTDVHIHHGRLAMPENDMIIGHEFIGKIEELGEGVEYEGLGQPLEVGDNCIACFYLHWLEGVLRRVWMSMLVVRNFQGFTGLLVWDWQQLPTLWRPM